MQAMQSGFGNKDSRSEREGESSSSEPDRFPTAFLSLSDYPEKQVKPVDASDSGQPKLTPEERLELIQKIEKDLKINHSVVKLFEESIKENGCRQGYLDYLKSIGKDFANAIHSDNDDEFKAMLAVPMIFGGIPTGLTGLFVFGGSSVAGISSFGAGVALFYPVVAAIFWLKQAKPLSNGYREFREVTENIDKAVKAEGLMNEHKVTLYSETLAKYRNEIERFELKLQALREEQSRYTAEALERERAEIPNRLERVREELGLRPKRTTTADDPKQALDTEKLWN